MHRVWFLFLVGLEYNITQPCKRRWYYLGNILQKCKKSLHFLEFDFFNCSWKNWIVSIFVASLISTTYLYYVFVCWPLDYLFKTYCWRKEGAFHGKTTRQGSKKKGRSYHHFCTYLMLYIWSLDQELFLFSQRFLPPLAKPIRNCIYLVCFARLYI